MDARVLILAYYFPPGGGSGVQRTSKFVRYLPDHGYEPVVVTGPGETGGRWTPRDASLGDDVPPEVAVHRVPGPVPGDAGGLRTRVGRFLREPSPFDRWWSAGAFETGRRCAADIVYASMSPFSSAEPAARLADELGVPWVADLRDPWALDEYFAYPTYVHWRLERRRMERELGSAAAIVHPTPGTRERFDRFFPRLRDRTVHIPNGFDPADFAGPASVPSDDSFHVVHAGYSYGDVGRRRLRRLLRGTDFDVDLRPRSPAVLLAAVDDVLAADPARGAAIRIHLAGPLTEHDEALIARARCGRQVVRHGYLPHGEAVRLVRSADALFLPMHELGRGARSTIVPGKLYEYLASGRPIVAAVPDGDPTDLLEGVEWAVRVGPTDRSALTAALLSLFETMASRRGVEADRSALLRRFERPALAAELAQTFDRALRAAPAVRPEAAVGRC
jgi:glycosyltransferase involved in cell wall biosynthesis